MFCDLVKVESKACYKVMRPVFSIFENLVLSYHAIYIKVFLYRKRNEQFVFDQE